MVYLNFQKPEIIFKYFIVLIHYTIYYTILTRSFSKFYEVFQGRLIIE